MDKSAKLEEVSQDCLSQWLQATPTGTIVGIGCDLVAIKRMRRLIAKHGERIAARILALSELKVYKQHQQADVYLAKRWAVKEAVVKAFGSGFTGGIRWREIACSNDPNGAPRVILLGQTRTQLQTRWQCAHIFISITDEADLAMAFCIIANQK